MQDSHSIENDFLNKSKECIEENLVNEQFGVSELANEMGMSRSNLLRRIKKLTNLSASQFIRQVRLKNAMELLKQNSYTVSEVSYQVGFSSSSYFIKCFHDHYGYPPGELGKRDFIENDLSQISESKRKRLTEILWPIIIVLLVVFVLYFIIKPFSFKQEIPQKSIAVLPFINDSNDSTNIHIINGLMESVLNDLQKIKDLRVISRTSVEKYRNRSKIIPEIAKELNVNYFVEGSGQKIGNQILLNIQLIDAKNDKHLWAQQYSREAKDIFKLQAEVAKNIAEQIEVIISPDVEERMNKAPTNDLVAYDYFLKGLDLLYQPSQTNLEDAVPYFEKAIKHDNEFARAHAAIAIAYFYMDLGQAEKKYIKLISYYSDKAMLLDSKLAQSLIAKALFYMSTGENGLAVPYFEKALEYNPNSALVTGFLADFYANYVPNTEKYLEYALKGIGVNIGTHDSITSSYIYLHVSNALIQSGFVDEAEKYINKSLEYDSGNLYSELVRTYISYARNKNLVQTKDLLIKTLNKDTTRLDIIQEVGKIYYYLRDYKSSYKYYKRFLELKKLYKLDISQGENAKIGIVFANLGLKKESERLFNDYRQYAEEDQSIYKHLSLAAYYSYSDDKNNAIEHLRLFSQQDNYYYWIILFLEIDPLFENIKGEPEFRDILDDIENNFWDYHNQIRASLEDKRII